MSKIKVREQIYRKHFNTDYVDIKFSDLPENMLSDDIIEIERVEAFFSENESYDAHTILRIMRDREETDEEYELRIVRMNKQAEASRASRYQSYLRLKEEFEPQK